MNYSEIQISMQQSDTHLLLPLPSTEYLLIEMYARLHNEFKIESIFSILRGECPIEMAFHVVLAIYKTHF